MTGSDKKKNGVSLFISDLIECRAGGKTRKKWLKNKRLSGFFIQQRTGIRPNRCFEQMLQSTNLSFFPPYAVLIYFRPSSFFKNIFCVIRRRHLLNSDFWGEGKQQLSSLWVSLSSSFTSMTGQCLWLFWESLIRCIFCESIYFFFIVCFSVGFIADVDKFVDAT